MEWIEAKITAASEALEIVGGLLLENGINGFQIEDDEEMKRFIENNPFQWDYVDEELLNKKSSEPGITFYVSNNTAGHEILLGVKSALKNLPLLDIGVELGSLNLTLANVNDEDWIDNWKKYYKPFEVGEKIIIRPVWEEYENKGNKIVFTINPGHVFGTGLHQSTRLCIIALEKHVNENTVLLDLGCGSGILSIISLMLGASHASATDIDPNASDIAYENACLNNIAEENYKVMSGNILTDEKLLEKIKSRSYNVVVANIVADVIIGLAPVVKELLEPCGVFISSGIINERVEDVTAAMKENNLEIIEINHMDGWASITCINKHHS